MKSITEGLIGTGKVTPGSWVLAAVLILAAAPAGAEVRAIQGGIEALHLYFIPGDPARVRAVPCGGCPNKTFVLAEDYKVFVNGEPAPRDQWIYRQGDPGTLIYNLETGRAVGLRYRRYSD